MIESLPTKQMVEQAVREVGTPSTEVGQPPTLPHDQDVQQFELALSEGTGMNPSAAAEYVPPQQTTTPESPGDSILRSLDAQRESFRHNLQEIDGALTRAVDNEHVSPAELLRLQCQLQQATLELEISTKVVEKGDEGISTLLKNQG